MQSLLEKEPIRASDEIWILLERSRRREAAMSRIAQEGFEAVDESRFLSCASTVLKDSLELDIAEVLKLQSDGSLLLFTASGLPADEVGNVVVSGGSGTQACFALESDCAIVVEDLKTETRFVGSPLLHEHGVVSGISIIIRRGRDAYGVLGAHSKTARAFHPDDISFFESIAGLVGATLTRLTVEERGAGADGIDPSFTADRDTRRALEDMNTVLEERVAERTQELQEAVDELESFTYSVSHDLRAPVRAARGFAEILLAENAQELNPEGKRLLGIIVDSTQKMGTLIEDLLTLSRIGRGEVRRQLVDMHRLFDLSLADADEAFPGSRVVVDRDDLGTACADERLLRHVTTNLLSNAFKFTSRSDGARVEIGRLRDGTSDVFFVRDNGVGFDPRYSDKLFAPFQRLHDPESFPGTGIGLAIAARVIRKHEGRIWAESEVGQGATFYFSLPEGGCDERDQ